MGKRIAIVQGHPDPAGSHFCHALVDAYATAAREAGHDVRIIEVADLAFPWLRNRQEFEHAPVARDIASAQDALRWCEHLLIVHPLWLGDMPALLKAFLEQALRPGFAHEVGPRGWKRLLAGKSARVIVTMGMPALVYRIWFGAHGLKMLERSILGFCGFGPIRHSLIGNIESPDRARRGRWLGKVEALGRRAR